MMTDCIAGYSKPLGLITMLFYVIKDKYDHIGHNLFTL